jgi:polysaccharide pyruvyl transferase WcaK-like protein
MAASINRTRKTRTALPPPASDATLARVSVGQSLQGPCVVWGGYGYGNTGDDLVLAVALANLRQRHGGNIQVLSPAPAQTRLGIHDTDIILCPSGRPRHKREKWFWRLADYVETGGMVALADRLYRLALKRPESISHETAWLKSLAAASTLHLVGGGYLTDRFDLRHFIRPLRLARSRRLPVTTSPLGLGPFRQRKRVVAAVEALRGAELVVRDEDSLRFCQSHGLAAVEKADAGFDWRRVVDLPATSPGGDSANRVGVCIFSQHSPGWSDAVEDWWVTLLQTLARTLPGYQLEGFCFHTGLDLDYETTRRLFARAGLNPDRVQTPQPDFRAVIKNLARYEGILSTRFHAVVTASGMQLPCVAINLDDYYETKMRCALKHATAPLSLANPLRDPPEAAAKWLAQCLRQDRLNAARTGP